MFDTLKVSTDHAGEEMAILLKRYGNLLPARSPVLAKVASQTSRVASAWSSLAPAEINIDVLPTILHIRIHWVEAIALRLDYDQATGIVSRPSRHHAILDILARYEFLAPQALSSVSFKLCCKGFHSSNSRLLDTRTDGSLGTIHQTQQIHGEKSRVCALMGVF